MKYLNLKLTALNFLLLSNIILSQLLAFEVENIPVQSEGRIKPFDSFARNQLLRFYGKREVKEHQLKATDWLIDLILDPKSGRDLKIFNIRNPEVVSSLFLDWTNEHKYSYNEVSPGLQSQLPLIQSVFDKKEDERDAFEAQLIEVYQNVMKLFLYVV